MKNNRGKIKISDYFLSNINSNVQELTLLFSNFIPIWIERDFDINIYHGVSILFDEVKEGDSIPLYDAIITNEKGDLKIEFKKL